MIKIHNINSIISNKIKPKKLKPFDDKMINFLSELSTRVTKSTEAKKNPEIMSFAFWIRRNNLIKLKKKYEIKKLNKRKGVGLLFHIPPSNIVSNFAYSLIFGLLSGNTNIIRLPEKSELMAKVLIKSMNNIKKIRLDISKYIYFIKNYTDDDRSNRLSSISDARLIWGGDKTVNLFKKFKTKKGCRNLYFTDKYSLSIFDSNKVTVANKVDLEHLIRNFYNDTYLVDQNACSSPNLIIWTGSEVEKAKKIFWSKLLEVVKKKYKLSFFSAVDKYTSSAIFSAKNNSISNIINNENLLIRIKLDKLNYNLENFRGKWGLFYEFSNKNKFKVNLPFSKKYQTITSYGYSKKQLEKLKKKSYLSSVNRIVQVGLSMEIDLFWDGYNILYKLTK
tara:strand:- start:1204 stop:2376 length:1173 start_codon:yes stop_codon:yes gene_type:complete